MCNLYSMTRAPEAVRRVFRVQHNRATALEPKNAYFPGYDAPIIRTAAQMRIVQSGTDKEDLLKAA